MWIGIGGAVPKIGGVKDGHVGTKAGLQQTAVRSLRARAVAPVIL